MKIEPGSPEQAVRLKCLELAVINVSKAQMQNFELVANKYWKWATDIQGNGGRPKDAPKPDKPHQS